MNTYQQTARRMYRSRGERQLTGLSGGIAQYFNVDPSLVRIGWVLATLTTFPVAPVVYLVAAMVIPNEPVGEPHAPVAGDTFSI